ncbi:hypothetical protein [Hyphomonas sp. GM-8P]|uniref:hypothetical protein n=1 Tax=Hyphomonas sp. GM-8P TaxID=1280945 RepID=UPI000DBF4966|nr:hypothetical protein [Hyphomonas sp. GM-8P]RAN39279.1 hypothetical protein HY26_16325 [Hyphomonas sp. GM-8P]
MAALHTIALFVLGLVMLAMAAGLDAMIRLNVSGWVQLLLAGFGVYLVVMSWFSLRFDRRRANVLETGTPQTVQFEINRTSDGESAAFLAEVKIGEDVWITPLRISRRVRKLRKQGELEGEAWLDGEGRLVALAHEGEQLRVMPFPRRKRFGRKDRKKKKT